MTVWDHLLTLVGLTIITVVTRSFFLLPNQEIPMPDWLKRGLRYAPLAALIAVIAPEVLMNKDKAMLINTLLDARLPAVLGSMAYYLWRRDILGTILVGMVIYLPLHIGLKW